MEDKDDFERFMQTGRIEDYLRYKNSFKPDKMEEEHKLEDMERKPHAGFRTGYRDGYQSNTGR